MTEVLNGNGHQKGRAVPPTATYTFSNGVVARLHPISQFTMAAIEIGIRKKYPPPAPPLNEVDYGDGIKKMEPNKADPEYEQALRDYRAAYSQKMFAAIIDLAADVEVDQVSLDRVRTTLERHGITIDEVSDKVAYLIHCCVFDIEEEMAKFTAALRALTGPSQEDVDDHVATFSGDVPRA